MGKCLVVIGGVAAGMSAAAKAKRVNREMEVVVYERSPYISYAACGMPYYISGEIAHHAGSTRTRSLASSTKCFISVRPRNSRSK